MVHYSDRCREEATCFEVVYSYGFNVIVDRRK